VRDELFETVSAVLPDEPLLGEPVIEEREPLTVERAGAHPPGLRGANQPAGLQRPHVLHEGRQRDGERTCQLSHTHRTAPQTANDLAPGRIGKRDEHLVERLRLVSHAEQYCAYLA